MSKTRLGWFGLENVPWLMGVVDGFGSTTGLDGWFGAQLVVFSDSRVGTPKNPFHPLFIFANIPGIQTTFRFSTITLRWIKSDWHWHNLFFLRLGATPCHQKSALDTCDLQQPPKFIQIPPHKNCLEKKRYYKNQGRFFDLGRLRLVCLLVQKGGSSKFRALAFSLIFKESFPGRMWLRHGEGGLGRCDPKITWWVNPMSNRDIVNPKNGFLQRNPPKITTQFGLAGFFFQNG